MDLCLQVFFADHADDLLDLLPAFEKKESRDRANIVLGRDGAVFIHVYFSDRGGISQFAREFFEKWSDGFTRTAPWRPEVHEDRAVRAGYRVVEALFV